ncbi:hypothetical protein TSTA_080830 [Talaromyces stipitatus ATCC 10500]|uniref:Retrovirus-related Pol polyprotein from transposon TNT 1-94-like beta-barrel domain-containing protein n=1 Tax=Talaromyces stipitatus (strain ATCC 10500 / CBS 375.48 / QM 6759 / NRRL 1006) TaxID=441959 RepID=B8LZR8_TALSN|nr:uncharacterized protein TSTA_080830 [Talaromyces stipitatus ATCC 10500]EED20850.1 hypothetical protein TSTA_080830 [Talaromyces stipitatus ATCC 10500]
MSASNTFTSGEKLPILDYSNWVDWSEYWQDHLILYDLWQYIDPTSIVMVPPPTTNVNRDIAKMLTENLTKIRQHVSPECRKLLVGHTNPRDLWSSLKAGCDRGTTLPLIAQYKSFHNNKWELKDTISTYTSRFRNIFLSLENTSYKIHRDIAVHILVDRLPDCYKTKGQMAKQLNLPFIEIVTYLLANIKDSSSEGDNMSGQALVTRGRCPNRRTSSRNLRNGGNNSNSNRRERSNRNSRNKRLICNWCKREGHYERDCHIRQQQLDSGAAKLDRGRAYLVQQPSSLQPPPQPLPLLAPPPPQANFSSSQSQSSESNAYSYPSHLLLTRASYINSEIQQQDYLSWILDSGATQHFCNSKLDLKDYKHFLEPREIYLGDNTTIYAEGSGTQHLQVGPYILVLNVCKSFNRVHADLIPLDGISLGGSKYMLLLVDDYTCYAWCYFASSKNVPAITPLLQGFINLVLTQFNAIIKSWRTDGGTGEFINSMNSVLERQVQTIKNMERSMRAGAGVLDDYRLQAESLATSVFLTNILPSTTLGNISPHLLLYKKQPPLTILKPWGCLVWIHLRKEHRSSSSDPRCRPAMMSIYKCLDLHTLQTSNHSEIKFDEDLFPGPWLKRPASFKLSIAHKRNLPGSAVNTVLGQSVPGALLNVSSVPFSLMNPFWLQQSQPPADPVNPEDPAKPVDPMELADVAQRALDSPQELVEAALIVQGMESLSCPSWQTAERIQTDHNGDPLSYLDALLQDPIRWPPAVQEELKSHEENGTWIVQEISQMPKGCKPIPGKWVFKRKPSPDEGIRYKV